MRHLSDDGIIYIYGLPEILAHVAVKRPIDKQRWLVWHYTNKTVPRYKFWQRSHESILCLWNGDRTDIHIDAVWENHSKTFLNNSAGKVRRGTYCRYSTKGKETIYQNHPNGACTPQCAENAGVGGRRWAQRTLAYVPRLR